MDDLESLMARRAVVRYPKLAREWSIYHMLLHQYIFLSFSVGQLMPTGDAVLVDPFQVRNPSAESSICGICRF